jgi:dephospho-CoA kinase
MPYSQVNMDRPYVIVLTGGIASGKTSVSDCFSAQGVPVIDTDIIARELVQVGMPAHAKLVTEFGSDFFHPDGSLNRKKMRETIFNDRLVKKRLETILHPAIENEVLDRISQLTEPYCILVIPLYVESKTYKWADRILVTDAPEDIQVDRVMRRDGIDENQARSIVAAQASREERLNVADDVIENSGDLGNLERQVEKFHQKYLRLAEKI